MILFQGETISQNAMATGLRWRVVVGWYLNGGWHAELDLLRSARL